MLQVTAGILQRKQNRAPTAWLGLLTLIVLDLVLGIDNLVFITIMRSHLPRAAQSYLCDQLVLRIADAPWLAGEHPLDVLWLDVHFYAL